MLSQLHSVVCSVISVGCTPYVIVKHAATLNAMHIPRHTPLGRGNLPCMHHELDSLMVLL